MRTVPKPSQLVSTAPLRIADEERFAEIVSEWAATHRRPSGRVVTIATDGAYHRAVGGGAVAWVSDDGRHGAARARCSSSFHAELIAIDEAIRAQPQFSRVHLLIDSRQALDAVALVLDRPPQRRERSDSIERRLSSISGASANREVTVEWVRGHNGHPLNDAADRIAVLVRRSAAWATGVATSVDLATSIAQDAAVAFATSRRPTE